MAPINERLSFFLVHWVKRRVKVRKCRNFGFCGLYLSTSAVKLFFLMIWASMSLVGLVSLIIVSISSPSVFTAVVETSSLSLNTKLLSTEQLGMNDNKSHSKIVPCRNLNITHTRTTEIAQIGKDLGVTTFKRSSIESKVI